MSGRVCKRRFLHCTGQRTGDMQAFGWTGYKKARTESVRAFQSGLYPNLQV